MTNSGSKRKSVIPSRPAPTSFFGEIADGRSSSANPHYRGYEAGKNPPWPNYLPCPRHTRPSQKQTPSRSSSRYSSNDQITKRETATGRTSRPCNSLRFAKTSLQTANQHARTGGSHALPVVKNEKSLCSRLRCASSGRAGSSATDRASKPSVKAAHPAKTNSARDWNLHRRQPAKGIGDQK